MTEFAKQHDVKKLLFHEWKTVLEAVQYLNDTASQILFIVDDSGKLSGTLTDGDIRRCISAGKPLSTPVGEVCNPSPKTVSSYSLGRARTLMERHGISRVPWWGRKGSPWR